MGPLEGLKVVELAGIGPGPYACMLLADMGADVVRLERGDWQAAPDPSHDALARSRDSVAVNLKSDAGRALALELIDQADVLIEGFRPGVAERLGLGPDETRTRNPRLVYARMTGWGQEGPLAQRAGHDINYIAYSGALSMIGRDGERPVPPINLVGDFGGGSLFLVAGVLAAIYAARTSGEGQVVDVSMVDGAASLTTMLHGFMNAGFWSTRRGTNLLDGGAPFYDTYETSDARYVAVGAIEPQFYLEFVRGLGLEPSELPAQMDHAHWSELRARFAEIFLTKTRDEWDELFRDTDACVSPVLDLAEARTHPVNHARHVFGPDGTPNPAPRFSATPSSVRQPSRRAGSGTTTALARWGVASTRLDDLAARGAFN